MTFWDRRILTDGNKRKTQKVDNLISLRSMLFVCLFVSFSLVSSTEREVESDDLLEIYGHYKEWKKSRAEYVHLSRDYPLGWKEFSCQFPVERFPTENIHTLAPWNVGVIASLGDSLSAGRSTGAEHLEDLMKDFPQLAFVSGWEKPIEEEVTLYNIFKQFNSSLSPMRDFNVAKTGALSTDLMRQIKVLEKELRNSKTIDFWNDWKFINIFVGSNDLCKMCQNKTLYNPEQYYIRLKEALLFIKTRIPRSFVNVMPPLEVALLLDTHENAFCFDFHQKLCSCLLSMDLANFVAEKQKFDEMVFKVVAEMGETKDFATVSAPIIAKIDHLPLIGNVPNIAFTALDCYHFSIMAADMVAKLVWTGLFQSANNKDQLKVFDFNPKTWDCPPPGCPFLRTFNNSEKCSIEKVRYPSLPRTNDSKE